MLRLLTTAAFLTAAAVSESRYKQVGKRLVGPTGFTGPPYYPTTQGSWSVSLSPDGAVLAMAPYNQSWSQQPPSSTTSVFRYSGIQYEPVGESTLLSDGATSVSANGTYLAMGSYFKLQGHITLPGGVFHYNDGGYHQVDVYDDHVGVKLSDGGVLSADGTHLATTTKWSSAVTSQGMTYSQPEEIGIFVYSGFAYHGSGIPSWTIDPWCLANFLPWRLSLDGTILNIGPCVFNQGRPIPVPTKGTGCLGTCFAPTSTALSSDGLVLAIGYSDDDDGIGAAWVFRYNVEVREYNQVGDKLVGTGVGSPPHQGTSVSLSSDGSILAVGGPYYNVGIGAVWLYRYDGNTYQQFGDRIVASDYGTQQGNAVSLSSDGTLLAVGGKGQTGGGVAWVFRSETEPNPR